MAATAWVELDGVEARAPAHARQADVLSEEALRFVVGLQREFGRDRDALLRRRVERRAEFDAGALPDFLEETRQVRAADWKVAPAPPDLQRRRVEITGPTDRKMVINALSSGADCFMADFEDANTPSWANMLDGQVNLIDANARTIELRQDDRVYRLGEQVATLLVRPRGWHLPEKHVLVDGEPISASLFDFGLYVFHNARRLAEKGSGPYFYLPDRARVTMTAPFMRAYTELLVKTCRRRGAFAIGGMAAFIPSRRDPTVNAVALPKVREDKLREAGDGFDGTWVAHPDLVPVAMEVFRGALGDRPNQRERRRPDAMITAARLLDVHVLGGQVTEAGLRNNIRVGIQYIESWLRGSGAVALNDLMEDAATAEISRSQVWQWVHHGVQLADGSTVTRDLVRHLVEEELTEIRQQVGERCYVNGRFADATQLFEQVTLSEDFIEFLTVPAYELLQ